MALETTPEFGPWRQRITLMADDGARPEPKSGSVEVGKSHAREIEQEATKRVNYFSQYLDDNFSYMEEIVNIGSGEHTSNYIGEISTRTNVSKNLTSNLQKNRYGDLLSAMEVLNKETGVFIGFMR